MHRVECVVSGRVQMVMFRDFVRRAALHLDLVGAVRNQQDGTVFVVAEGPKEALERLIAELHDGPVFARVDDVKIDWEKPTVEFSSFTIL